jgi:membrane fusion protein
MSNTLFRMEALEYQKDRLHGDVLVRPAISHIFITLFLVFWVVALFIWLLMSDYRKTETVTGWIEPSLGLIRIFPADRPGKVTQILVEEGQIVKKGQVLATINSGRLLEDGHYQNEVLLQEYKNQTLMLKQQLVRSETMSVLRTKNITQQFEAAKLNLNQLKKQIVTIKKWHQLVKNRAERYQKIQENGYISQENVNSTIETELSIKSQLQEQQRILVTLENNIQQFQTQLMLLPQEYKDTVDQIQSNLSIISQRVIELKGQRAYTLKAPLAGYITNVQIKEGQQTSNIPLMTIVPENSVLQAKLLIPVRAAGFVKANQNIEIRYDAFPYQKFGLYQGTISKVSSALLLPNELYNVPIPIQEPTYLVQATLDKDSVIAYGKELPLKSGITFSADIYLSERSLLEWLLEPIFSLQGRI